MAPSHWHDRLGFLLRWALILLAVLVGSTLLSTLLVLRCAPANETPPAAPSLPDTTVSDSGSRVKVEMRRVWYHVDPDIVLDTRSLRGNLVSAKHGEIPVFEDPNSFTIQITSAELATDTLSLSRLLNRYVFGYPGAPLHDVQVGIE